MLTTRPAARPQVVEDVTLPTVKAIDGAVVQPTVQATQSAAHFVQDTAANTAGALAGTAVRGCCRAHRKSSLSRTGRVSHPGCTEEPRRRIRCAGRRAAQ